MAPDVPGILAALARLPGTSRAQRARLRVGRDAIVHARRLRAGRSVSPRTRALLSANASYQARDERGRFA